MQALKIASAAIFIIVVVAVVVFAGTLGTNTDTVELTHAIKHQTTMDEIQEMRELEQRPFPYGLMCSTLGILGFFMVILNLKELNKLARNIKALNPFSSKAWKGWRRGGAPTPRPATTGRYQPPYQDPQYPQLPASHAQAQLGTGEIEDF